MLGKTHLGLVFLSSDIRCWINQRVKPDFQNIPMDGVSADGVGQLGEDRGEGKADDREEEGGGEALDQAGPQGETAMEAKDKQGKSHGSDQGGGGEQLPQQQVVDAPKDQHAANLSGRTWFAGTVRFLAFCQNKSVMTNNDTHLIAHPACPSQTLRPCVNPHSLVFLNGS